MVLSIRPSSTIPLMAVQCTASEREEIKQNISETIELTKFFGFDNEGFDITPTVNHWCTLIGYLPIDSVKDVDGTLYRKSRTITLTKYKTAAFVAAWTHTNLPPHPFRLEGSQPPETIDIPHTLIGGRYHVFVTRYLLKKPFGDMDRLSYLQTIIQSKALMVRPDEEYVRYAEIKTFEKLTGKVLYDQRWVDHSTQPNVARGESNQLDRGDENTTINTQTTRRTDDDEISLSTSQTEISTTEFTNQQIKESIRASLLRTVQAIFTTKYTDQHRLAYTLPSASSNYNFTRKEFGALGHLLPHAQRLNKNNRSLVKFNRISVETDEEMEVDDEKYEVDVKELTKTVYEFRKSVFDEAMQEIPYAEPLGLSEPSKVRVITKGPPATYFILKPLQKFMHNTMRKIPQFELMGREINPNMINSMFGKVPDNHAMLSGDYSDATNELKMWVSEEVTKAVVTTLGLSEKEAILVKKSLTEHIMLIKTKGEKSPAVETKAKQTEGQLMGSILSFIWLCITNITLVWMTKEGEVEEEIPFNELQCLINGDDCLFSVSSKGKYLWAKYGALMGLKPSIGKVFFTNEFCTLNSRMFAMRDGKWIDVPFISSSLLSGKEKSVRLGTERLIDPLVKVNDVGQRNYWLMLACPKYARHAVQKKFIQNNSNTLKHPLLHAIDWFMPTWSGGLGMCDVSENGWVYNYEVPGNPEREIDDDLQPVGEWKRYCDERNNDQKRKKSRGALYHMLTNWSKAKFRPIPWTQPRTPDGLDMISTITSRMPTKPTEQIVSYLKPIPEDNINDALFGLLAMDAYLTDKRTQDLIRQDYVSAINEDFLFPFMIENGSILQINRRGEINEVGKVSGKTNKRKIQSIHEQLNEYFNDEHVKRVKHNRAIWENNIKKGCTKLASYEKIQTRRYQKVFRGKIVGKGINFLESISNADHFNYDFIWDQDALWGKNATQPIQEW